MSEQETYFGAWISRRARGVYLVHLYEDRDGDESWDAFPTLAEAKRWARRHFDLPGLPAPRLRWKQGQPGDLRAGAELVETIEDDGTLGAAVTKARWVVVDP